ncbi:MAG TPA: 2-dehydro-3-deoxy-6-phosphogalactonate aldolase [Caldimonas sp.]|nr:2-dehydro-3-deoxy-6-phosphogalactonate aldolase [Caldimonas sp.]HEX4234770.1 2-dehydro-3-deoxy-6-phosphogalactonate aldolase [Caldimonas sp.]
MTTTATTTAVQQFAVACAELPLLAVLRGVRPDEAVAIGTVLVEAGWRMLEVPLNSPEPLLSIAALADAFPDALVGAGTVLSAGAVRDAHAAGARLIVAPNFDRDVVRAAVALDIVALPGVLSASEAYAALGEGATGLKLVPAEMIPPAAVKALRAVLDPAAVVLPVGGISLANIAAYRAAGASGFGIGSSLYKPGMAADDVGEIARRWVAAWPGSAPASSQPVG